jgi:IclR family transcriptional regulator, acetate operon repressor
MAVDTPSSRPRPVRSATRVLDLLDALQAAPEGLGLRDISKAAGMPKSTALRYLATLEERRYVDRDPESGIYRLGLAIPSQAQFFARLRQAVRPSLERLRDRFDETITFSMLDGDHTTLLDIVESRQAIRLGSEIGARGHLHSTAIGKAVASTLPEGFIRRVIDTVGLPQRTPNTITDPERYLQELDEIRARGYSFTNEENNIGTHGVAVALPTKKLRGAIGLSAPNLRFDPDAVPAIAKALQTEAEEIARTLESREA